MPSVPEVNHTDHQNSGALLALRLRWHIYGPESLVKGAGYSEEDQWIVECLLPWGRLSQKMSKPAPRRLQADFELHAVPSRDAEKQVQMGTGGGY